MVFTFDGKEQIACLRLSRVDADIFDDSFPIAMPDFSVAGFSDKSQRAFFHKIYFSKNVAVTTAVMVFSAELVSFWPSQLVCELCNGVI